MTVLCKLGDSDWRARSRDTVRNQWPDSRKNKTFPCFERKQKIKSSSHFSNRRSLAILHSDSQTKQFVWAVIFSSNITRHVQSHIFALAKPPTKASTDMADLLTMCSWIIKDSRIYLTMTDVNQIIEQIDQLSIHNDSTSGLPIECMWKKNSNIKYRMIWFDHNRMRISSAMQIHYFSYFCLQVQYNFVGKKLPRTA